MKKAKPVTVVAGNHRAQVAALPFRFSKNSKLEVLLVTSRDTGRWIPPKGWLIKGKTSWSAAKIEAREEAGAIGFISKTPLGTYCYKKLMDGGTTVECLVTVYPMFVRKLRKQWDEKHERKRRWFTPKKAAQQVQEPELRELILGIDKPPNWMRTMSKKQ